MPRRLLRRRVEVEEKAAAKAAKHSDNDRKQKGSDMSPEQWENFKLWRAEGDHARKCPKCGETYHKSECCKHYKRCPELKELRESHQQ